MGDWDSKRDRWHGVDVKQWDEIARNWDDIKKNINSKKQKKRGLSAGLNEDEDDSDTDYELELTELGLDQKDVTNKLREDPLEKTLRDRQDVPAYIQNINSGRSGKVSYEKLGDSKNSEIVNDQSEFVRGRTEEIKKLESFAWEQAEKSEKEQQRIILEKRLNGEMDVNSDGGGVLDLDLNLAANPTAIAVKVRQQEVEKRLEREIKRKKLEDRYN